MLHVELHRTDVIEMAEQRKQASSKLIVPNLCIYYYFREREKTILKNVK